jgi:hypothetical protein
MVLELFTLPSVPIYRLGINRLSFRKQRIWASFQAHGRCFREWPILIWRVAYFGQHHSRVLSVFDPQVSWFEFGGDIIQFSGIIGKLILLCSSSRIEQPRGAVF